MKITQVLDELKFVDESAQIKCSVPKANIESRVNIVGQVKHNTPGVILGEREPYLREKIIGTFIEELKTFGKKFQGNEFLIEVSHDLNAQSYELRYYKLTHVEVKNNEVVLISTSDELLELREFHQEEELE